MIGIEVAISLAEGQMRITPVTDGPEKSAFRLNEIGPFIFRDNKQYSQSKVRMAASLRKRVEPLWSCPVDRFHLLAAESTKLTEEYKADIAAFLERTSPRAANGASSAFEQWVARGDVILRQAQAIPLPGMPVGGLLPGRLLGPVTQQDYDALMAQPRQLWRAEYSDRLKAWFDDFCERHFEVMDDARACLAPLRAPVRITVTRITTAAFDPSGKQFEVTLANPAARSAQSEKPAQQDDHAGTKGPATTLD